MAKLKDLLSCLLIFSGTASFALAFAVTPDRLTQRNVSRPRQSFSQRLHSSSALYLNWFQGKGDKKESGESSEKRQGMGGVVGVMDSMDSFKKAQRVGKMTEAIVQELSTIVVEGVAADGRVRVFVDGQQRPKGVDIDESYIAETPARDVSSALTTAMQDAYDKSSDKMEDKMRAFYGELGLPSS